MKKVIINQKEAQKGITLIALVITIIVLLILAGVSIAMLTGQKGILTQANNAKNETELASAKEKVELAVIGAISQTRDGTLKVGNLRTELANYGGTVEGDTFPVTAKVDGKSFTVDANGNVELAGSKPQMTDAKIVASADGTGTDVPDNQAEGTELYISFKASLENGTIVDCALFAPEPLGLIGIDSKFPLENYRNMVDKNNSKELREKYEKQFKIDMKKHIDSN